jgi:murein L,D-transpeptidase YafK
MRNQKRGMKLLSTLAMLLATVGALSASGGAHAMEAAVADTPGYSANRQQGLSDFGLPAVDSILVRKRERRMYLMRQGEVLRTYRISLGLSPDGHKTQEGDFKTPEGKYRLIRRNPRSDYFLSMEVSYPNEEDVARARKMGVRPGGAIMIHGLPNTPRKGIDYYLKNDWTDGCISVSNSDMVEIWMMTPVNTPIEIVP